MKPMAANGVVFDFMLNTVCQLAFTTSKEVAIEKFKANHSLKMSRAH